MYSCPCEALDQTSLMRLDCTNMCTQTCIIIIITTVMWSELHSQAASKLHMDDLWLITEVQSLLNSR